VAVELYNLGHQPNFFYLEHGMGLASSMGLGLAVSLPKEKVTVLDGDGSVLMNLGSLSTLARYRPPNLTHWIFDNESLLSVGGFPTATGAGPKSDCTASGAPGTAPDPDYLRITGWAAQFTGGVPERGALVRGYGSLTYRFAASTFFTANTALWRGTQELVGPFDNTAAFSYVMSDGSVRSSVAGIALDSVIAVRLTATAIGEGSNPHSISRPVTFDVPFRN